MTKLLFQSPNRIIFGDGSVETAGRETKKLGNKALIVTGKNSVKKSGALDKLIKSLEESDVGYVLFDQVESDPDVKTVEKGVELSKINSVDVIVAMGGGSPLDAAKAISIMITNLGKIQDYEGKGPEKPVIPIIAIPTTAGTGSEVSRYTVITDSKRKVKMLIGSDFIIPTTAILDAELTVSMPPQVTAATGMDALTHAIEAYISKVSTPFSDTHAVEAIKLISKNLISAVCNGDNLEARRGMLYGQMHAGLAFSNASVALVHAMSRPLGAHFGVPHGAANAMLLPVAMEYNRSSCTEKMKIIAEAMGEITEGLSVRGSSYKAVEAIKTLFDETNLEGKLRNMNIPEESLMLLAEDASKSGSCLFNPRKASKEDIYKIYKSIF
ncbi:alcohol dehydrogenase [Clostridium polyendosporum]|uniref:Alcohol dehydrogenase n=1 Tax=Clostridium polyendosporum TaxID=69208 RepID=A0A919S0K9_9CLOT|nr:iron-containing alcohol dehydrogenase [Clostridium polyendosporum]GIM29083.1 alcohol dehydrogenase [Clostridium polyendosporum]